MELGATPCKTCADIRTLHPQGGKCVRPGCTCEAFVPVPPPVTEAAPEAPWRRVCIDLPVGYSVTVTLTPEGS